MLESLGRCPSELRDLVIFTLNVNLELVDILRIEMAYGCPFELYSYDKLFYTF